MCMWAYMHTHTHKLVPRTWSEFSKPLFQICNARRPHEDYATLNATASLMGKKYRILKYFCIGKHECCGGNKGLGYYFSQCFNKYYVSFIHSKKKSLRILQTLAFFIFFEFPVKSNMH